MMDQRPLFLTIDKRPTRMICLHCEAPLIRPIKSTEPDQKEYTSANYKQVAGNSGFDALPSGCYELKPIDDEMMEEEIPDALWCKVCNLEPHFAQTPHQFGGRYRCQDGNCCTGPYCDIESGARILWNRMQSS